MSKTHVVSLGKSPELTKKIALSRMNYWEVTDIFLKVCDGNPGAYIYLIQLKEKIDHPGKFTGLLMYLLSENLIGTRLYSHIKDVCVTVDNAIETFEGLGFLDND